MVFVFIFIFMVSSNWNFIHHYYCHDLLQYFERRFFSLKLVLGSITDSRFLLLSITLEVGGIVKNSPLISISIASRHKAVNSKHLIGTAIKPHASQSQWPCDFEDTFPGALSMDAFQRMLTNTHMCWWSASGSAERILAHKSRVQ